MKKKEFEFASEDYIPKKGDIVVEIVDGQEQNAEIYIGEKTVEGVYALTLDYPYEEFRIPVADYNKFKKKGEIKLR